MQLKFIFTGIIACTAVVSVLGFTPGAAAQVAPAAYRSGRPIGIGVGMSSYDLDYGHGRMEGPVIRASVGIFHGFGIDGSARSLFMFTPQNLSRMQQSTFLAGAFYQAPTMFHVRPFVRAAGGLGVIEFPSRNPKYTRDSYTVYAPSGGIEIPVSRRVALRGEYEYQFWKDFQSTHYLNPQGFTIGVSYYINGQNPRRHRSY